MSDSVDCAVIGAGAIGLAIARELALAGQEVVILDSADAIGMGISSRNSEVIHAGIYYPKGSLKARFCVKGNRMLRSYLADRNVDYRMVGKLIVAADRTESPQLDILWAKARANGAMDVRILDSKSVEKMEPNLRCEMALFSPATGIFDAHGYMLSLLADAEEKGATLALKSPVLGGEVTDHGITLHVGGEEPSTLIAKRVVNAAGFGAHTIAASINGVLPKSVPPLYLCKGNYFLLSGASPFTRLIYPVPETSDGLGVHFTMDMTGQGRFGPDTEWVEEENYLVEEERASEFYPAIHRYWPELPEGALRPGYAGIRPKLRPQYAPASDFVIQDKSIHGVEGLVSLFGIESPGLTSSLAIAEYVAELLK